MLASLGAVFIAQYTGTPLTPEQYLIVLIASVLGSFGTAANGTTSSANLIDTYALGGTEKVVNNIDDKSTNGKSVQKMTLSQFVTMTGSASTAGLVADVYVHYYTT